MNAWDYVLIVLISLWVIGAVIYLIYRKIKGKNCCGDGGCQGNCSACAAHCKHKKK